MSRQAKKDIKFYTFLLLGYSIFLFASLYIAGSVDGEPYHIYLFNMLHDVIYQPLVQLLRGE